MQDNKFLYISLGVGFFIVALVFFYEDYAPLVGLNPEGLVSQQPTYNYEPPSNNNNAATLPIQSDGGSESSFHVVKEGETVFSIAKQYGVTPNQLVSLNPQKITDTGTMKDGLPVYRINPGDNLRVKVDSPSFAYNPPDATGGSPIDGAADFIASLDCSDYLCPHSKKKLNKHKEALESTNSNAAKQILRELVRIDETYYSNGYRTDEYDLTRHKVRNSDTIYTIAQKYGVPVKDIPKYNPSKIIFVFRLYQETVLNL